MGSTVWCLHHYMATFKIATCKERGHILATLFAETIASETKYFLCCPESGARKASLPEKTTNNNWLLKPVKKSTSQTSVLPADCALTTDDRCCSSTAGKTSGLYKALLTALAITSCFLINPFPHVHQPTFRGQSARIHITQYITTSSSPKEKWWGLGLTCGPVPAQAAQNTTPQHTPLYLD